MDKEKLMEDQTEMRALVARGGASAAEMAYADAGARVRGELLRTCPRTRRRV